MDVKAEVKTNSQLRKQPDGETVCYLWAQLRVLLKAVLTPAVSSVAAIHPALSALDLGNVPVIHL
jgi:hypothetical protein